MSVSGAIFDHLAQDAGVSALVENEIRKSFGRSADMGDYIMFQELSGPRFHDMSGSSGMANPRWQFNCMGDTYEAAESIAEAVRNRMDGFHGTMGSGSDQLDVRACQLQDERDGFDNPTDATQIGKWEKQLDFRMIYRESKPNFGA